MIIQKITYYKRDGNTLGQRKHHSIGHVTGIDDALWGLNYFKVSQTSAPAREVTRRCGTVGCALFWFCCVLYYIWVVQTDRVPDLPKIYRNRWWRRLSEFMVWVVQTALVLYLLDVYEYRNKKIPIVYFMVWDVETNRGSYSPQMCYMNIEDSNWKR